MNSPKFLAGHLASKQSGMISPLCHAVGRNLWNRQCGHDRRFYMWFSIPSSPKHQSWWRSSNIIKKSLRQISESSWSDLPKQSNPRMGFWNQRQTLLSSCRNPWDEQSLSLRTGIIKKGSCTPSRHDTCWAWWPTQRFIQIHGMGTYIWYLYIYISKFRISDHPKNPLLPKKPLRIFVITPKPHYFGIFWAPGKGETCFFFHLRQSEIDCLEPKRCLGTARPEQFLASKK